MGITSMMLKGAGKMLGAVGKVGAKVEGAGEGMAKRAIAQKLVKDAAPIAPVAPVASTTGSLVANEAAKMTNPGAKHLEMMKKKYPGVLDGEMKARMSQNSASTKVKSYLKNRKGNIGAGAAIGTAGYMAGSGVGEQRGRDAGQRELVPNDTLREGLKNGGSWDMEADSTDPATMRQFRGMRRE
jgi:hypothetical protein